MAICCIALSQSAYSADELYDSELSGLAYINIPFAGNKGHSSPTFSFTVTQTPTTNITSGSANYLNSFLINPNRKALFDMQYDLSERQWSRFAFGGINSLVYDDVLHANGGGPSIDPKLIALGIGAGVGLYFLLDDDDDDPHPCTEGLPPRNGDPFTLNLHELCEPERPAPSDMRLKRDIVKLVTLENGIKLYSFRYLWEDTVYVGVMAQDLLEHESYKDAVVMQQSGFYAVHYEMLGLKMITLEEWHFSQLSIYSDHKIAANL
jgi:hypothetical protein